MPVLFTLFAYHASFLMTSLEDSPLSTPSSLESSWLSSLSPFVGRRRSIGAEAARLCRPSSDQQRLADMLNMMESLEQLDPANLNTMLLLRGQHNLSGICPTFQASEPLVGLENQSLCPWTLEENYQADRFPRLLYYARCICGHCSGPGWGETTMHPYSCIPLYHRVAVIREVCIENQIHFRWDRESVPVGCVCAHPPTRQVD